MQNNHPHLYVMPLVKEKVPSSSPTTPPPTQRELVKASFLLVPPRGSERRT
jgi:hypothetical protein